MRTADPAWPFCMSTWRVHWIDAFPQSRSSLLFDGLKPCGNGTKRSEGEKQILVSSPTFTIQSNDPARDAKADLKRIATAAFRRPVEDQEMALFIVTCCRASSMSGQVWRRAAHAQTAAIFLLARFPLPARTVGGLMTMRWHHACHIS